MRIIEINKACELWFMVSGSWLMVSEEGEDG